MNMNEKYDLLIDLLTNDINAGNDVFLLHANEHFVDSPTDSYYPSEEDEGEWVLSSEVYSEFPLKQGINNVDLLLSIDLDEHDSPEKVAKYLEDVAASIRAKKGS